MLRSDFNYHLPHDLIAQEPRQRGHSRMMVVTPEQSHPSFQHRSFDSFPLLLNHGDILVINDTRVIPARLFADPKPGMTSRIEVLLVRQREPMIWEAWCRPARRVREGDVLRFSPALTARVLSKDGGTIIVQFDGDLAEVDRIGIPPLPPYIQRRESRDSDREDYQTVYAAERGAVAAPTAGLHFTREILAAIESRGVVIVPVTLHVGIGTFRPVKVDDVAGHRMDTEQYELTVAAAATLNQAVSEGRRIVAVGTTSVRTLESAAAAGEGTFRAGRAETGIFITPGYQFRVVDAMLTNFHLPESTLIMLVSAFAGMETVREAYRQAIENRYFFYSYGDCMFLTNRGSW